MNSTEGAPFPPWLIIALHALGWAGSVGWLAILAIGVAICLPSTRAFVGTYLKARAGTYATKQDLDEILRQLRLQTEATEDIKRRLSFAGWKDQRGWDLKREFYWNLIRQITERQQMQIEAHAAFVSNNPLAGFATHARILAHWPEVAAALNLASAVLEPASCVRLHQAAGPYHAAANIPDGVTTNAEWADQMQREMDAATQFLAILGAAARADLFGVPPN